MAAIQSRRKKTFCKKIKRREEKGKVEAKRCERNRNFLLAGL